MNPKENKYTQEHEWVRPEADGTGKIGLTDYAQEQLGDMVYLDLPEPGKEVQQFQKIGEIESVKSVSDIFSPVSGEITEINQRAIDEPNLVNEDPYGEGWLLKLTIENSDELDALMNSDQYDALVAKLCQECQEEG